MIHELIVIAFSGFWKFIGVFIIFYTVIDTLAILLEKLIRMIIILSRGWPPNHLDVDGDWKPETKEKDGTDK